jgi:hypothetical protein
MITNNMNNGMLSIPQLSQMTSTGAATSVGIGRDGDNDGSAGKVNKGRRADFMAALSQAFMQIGANGASTTSATNPTAVTGVSATQDPKQEMRTFMHDLFAALRSTGKGQQGGKDSDGDKDGSAASKVSATSGQYGASSIESKLQNLILQISSSDASSATGSATSASNVSATAPTSNTALSALQQDFSNLMGGSQNTSSGTQPTLSSFLQALTQNLQGANAAGNIVNTVA